MTGQGYPKSYRSDGSSYFDGDHPVAKSLLSLDVNAPDGMLEMRLEDGSALNWPVREIRLLPDQTGSDLRVVRREGDPLARLVLANEFVLREFPQLAQAPAPAGRGRLAAWAVAAVGAVALQIFVLVPLLADSLATFIPAAGERALGEATFGHIREALDETGLNPLAVCEAPAGRAALDRIVTALSGDGDFRQDITVSVLDHDMINAFALPGGFVVLFRGLIDAAETPDEVAAVLAHEAGHVMGRDPTRHALRSAGSIGVLGLLFGDFAGGAAVLFLTERLISAQYSQAAETGADAFAHGALAQAGISPGALGDMFANMRKAGGDSTGVVAHFLSHPSLSARIEAANAAVNPAMSYTPVLTDRQWADLQAICR